jgi:hypothetical protein
MSPDSAGGFVRRAAPEPNKRALYVGGLDPRVTEDVLRQIFETTGHVQNVKIIPDKNVGAVSINFICVKSFENSSSAASNSLHKGFHKFPALFPPNYSVLIFAPFCTIIYLLCNLRHANRGLVSV